MLGSASGLAGNWGSGFIFVHFSDLNLVNYSETFFSLSDKAMRGIGLLALGGEGQALIIDFYSKRSSEFEEVGSSNLAIVGNPVANDMVIKSLINVG
jgi:hypothetical protein